MDAIKGVSRRFGSMALAGLMVLSGVLAGSFEAQAQTSQIIVKQSGNRPLVSLRGAAEAARRATPPVDRVLREVPNFRGGPDRSGGETSGPDPLAQEYFGTQMANPLAGFEGADNEDNLAVLGFRVAPPDTDGDVGPSHIVQMVNLVTTVLDKNGNIVPGGAPFPSNAIWTGIGGNCEPFNQGDPVVLYDEANDRWVFSQFAFDDNFTTFSQCVAVSVDGDPLNGYHRYEFSFDGLGLPDYPKHGIVSDSITMTANLFAPPLFFFTGTFIGAMDKAAMYAGGVGTLVGSNLGSGQFGFLPADLDDPTGAAGNVPALFASAMSRPRRFDIWQIDVDWANPGGASAGRVGDVRISTFDSDLCGASREACIPQPAGAPALEAISDRLMHRLQLRQVSGRLAMLAAHTVDVDGNGRAGIRWYELRQNPSNGRWSKHQEGTYAPGDGLYRWMPSIAMNSAGDIGLGFLVSSGSVPMSVHYTGQTSASSGSGVMDAGEEICRAGVTPQTGTARSGDYSATSVDPLTDTFWHTNEYGQRDDKSAGWGTAICEFEILGDGGECVPTEPGQELTCDDGLDNDCDGLFDLEDPDCDPGQCVPTHNKEKGPRCSDGLDNDCDGLIDGADPDC